MANRKDAGPSARRQGRTAGTEDSWETRVSSMNGHNIQDGKARVEIADRVNKAKKFNKGK